MSDELLNCPLCESMGMLCEIGRSGPLPYFCRCADGCMETRLYASEQEAITAWNRRTHRDTPQILLVSWNGYLERQKRIIGAPGLNAKPAYEAGYRAGLNAGETIRPATGGDDKAMREACSVGESPEVMDLASGLPVLTCPCGSCAKLRRQIVAAAQADAEDAARYRWLRSHFVTIDMQDPKMNRREESLDRFIDAARQEPKT